MIGVLIDCSNADLSVALSKDHVILAKTSYPAWQEQSELLVAELDRLLKANNVTRQELSYVVVGKGPGSYTGVRIALSVAKVMTFALGVPLYLASSLELLKSDERASICIVNARSKRSYVGVYEGEKEVLKDQIMDNADLLAYIALHPDYALMGDLTHLNRQGTLPDIIANLNRADTPKNLCHDPLAAKPVYLKDAYPV